jgi:predicted RNA-binding protein with PIN domain
MQDRLIIVDGYNLIHRTPTLKPGPERTLRESREKLVNLLSWALGAGDARFLVVFDGDGTSGGREQQGRVETIYSRPPRKADDLIREVVEQRTGGDLRVTVVTSDLEVARHARAQGADVSLSDLFMASVLGSASPEEPEKPVSFSKKEVEEWAEIFTRRRPAPGPSLDEDDASSPE